MSASFSSDELRCTKSRAELVEVQADSGATTAPSCQMRKAIDVEMKVLMLA